MGDVGLALLAVVLIVGVVMLGVGLFAWFGVRYAGRTISESGIRRLAWFNLGFGVVALLFSISVLLLGAQTLVPVLGLVQGVVFIALGFTQLRELAAVGRG